MPTALQQYRYLRLFDLRWMLLEGPTEIIPVVEIMNSAGKWVPAVGEVTCPGCRHTHTMRRDRYGHLALSGTIEQRNDTEASWCETCQDVHEDRDAWYSACTLCDTHLDIPTRHTGEFSFPVVMEERLRPDTIELQMVDHPDGLSITHTVGVPVFLQDADGSDLFEVMVGEFRFEPEELGDITFDTPIRRASDRILLEVTPIGLPREIVDKLYGAVAAGSVT